MIDNSGRRVEWTRESARLLRDTVDRYVYPSSTGVYYPHLGSNITESTELVLEVPGSSTTNRAASTATGS